MIYLGADHGGFKVKEAIKKYLVSKNIDWRDLGNAEYDQSDDYPAPARAVALAVAKNQANRGILICGSGQGICMAANRFPKIRAALAFKARQAKASRLDNDSNVLCLSGWEVSLKQNLKIVETWLNTPFSKLARHQRRIKQLAKL